MKELGNCCRILVYQVDFAQDGAEAIALYRKSMSTHEPYTAVIMDLTIPGGMGGKEAIGELLRIDPQANALVFSGYSEDPVMANYREYGFRGVLVKPFDFHELARLLDEFNTQPAEDSGLSSSPGSGQVIPIAT